MAGIALTYSRETWTLEVRGMRRKIGRDVCLEILAGMSVQSQNRMVRIIPGNRNVQYA